MTKDDLISPQMVMKMFWKKVIYTPYFFHIKHLHALEEHNTLKVAYALKKHSLNSSGISRTSPQHAFGK